MNIRMCRSIAEIPASKWNQIVTPGHVIATHEYLSAIEEAEVNDCRYFYPVVYDRAGIAAHACVYFISTELDSFAQGMLKWAIGGIRKAWNRFLILRSIECGTPVALGNTISFRSGIDKTAALRPITDAIERIARELGVGVVLFRDFTAEELPVYDALQEAGYRRIQNLPVSRLTLRWNGFAQYLNSMRSHYRHTVQARMKTFQQAGGTLEVLQDLSAVAPELARLWQNAYNHAREYRREILKPAFFESIQRHLGSRASVLLARIENHPVGFSLLLDDHETLIWLFCGLDYEYNKDSAVYFNMLYRIVDIAMAREFKMVDLGITTVVPKMDIGADVVPLYMYMKHLHPLLARPVPALFAAMTPKQQFEPRHVFKSDAQPNRHVPGTEASR